ncbi:Co-chaperone Hsc20 [Hypoxylon rubiginosum]|uniref:Co-chaperone Hsc20 n=1 Tax=Hypoxylon rubiginosum TaxID=110542 RepID=A0ACC0CIA3_9PEZI|nr:Co-chaperone Hsc20 [Hypoxylon rubiginosum]
MRSLLPRQPLRRVCDACKLQLQRQRLKPATRTFSHAASIPAVASSKTPYQPTNPRLSISRARSIRGNLPQTRSISSNAQAPSESHHAAAAEPETRPPPPTKTHYDLFPQTLPAGPPPAGPFAIDARALRREFLTLQATAHPDLAPAGAASKRAADAVSSRINDAYRTLLHTLTRAQYLLSLRGIDVANEETARVADPELLMLVLETREAIEEADSEAQLEPLRQENEERIAESEGRLAGAFARDDLEEARGEVTRLRYWVNIRESIHNWERGKPVVLEH